MTSEGSGKIWILVADWSRVKSSEPNAGDVTRKIGPLYFKSCEIVFCCKNQNKNYFRFKFRLTTLTKHVNNQTNCCIAWEKLKKSGVSGIYLAV